MNALSINSNVICVMQIMLAIPADSLSNALKNTNGPCTVRPIQFSIFSTIIEKSYFVSVKGLLFIFELAI